MEVSTEDRVQILRAVDALVRGVTDVNAVVDVADTPCPFCEIIAGRAPAVILEEWTGAMAIKPLNPVTPGHVLIIPKVHVADFAVSPLVSATVMEYAARFTVEWGVGDANVITSRGAAATQTVEHLHLHVIPRTVGDGLHLPWTGQVP
jgi:histidine triad (HIT) family protein